MKKTDFLLFLIIMLTILAGTLAYLGSQTSAANSSSVVSDTRESVKLPVLMYHGITENVSESSEYTISSDTFESDLRWLGDNGFTTVSAKQLIDYVESGSALPSKPVLITFDDGYRNNYTLAFPLLQKYHMKAVISVIGSQSDISSGDIYRSLFNSNLSWGEIALMASSGNIEIGNHTYDLHSSKGPRKGAGKKSGESQADYAAALTADLSKNQEKIRSATGSESLIFAWPFGEYPADGSADEILKEMGFKLTLTSYQKNNEIKKGDPDSLFGLKRFLRAPDFDMNKII